MNKKNSIWLLVAVWTLVSCGTVKSTREKPAVALAQSSLTPEQQRKYDYFFLEAMRLKEKKDYASAFGLLQHCLDIHPNAASALYEVSQYYMFLRQVPQGQEALEKAVANAPDNYWYSQGLASLYQQQNELDKAVTCWNRWWYVFLPSRTRFSTFWTCMADKKSMMKSSLL